MLNPKLSIITPSFNQGRYIRQTIESVLMQNYANFEHIIVDGLSTDNTIEILKEYSHLKWISEIDNGPANALNKGFKIATGDLLCWINSDDYYEKNIFKYVVEQFEKNSKIDFLCGNLKIVDEKNYILEDYPTYHFNYFYLTRMLSDVVRQPATFFTRNIFKKVGELDEKLSYVFDYELFVRMLKITNPIFVNKNLAYYRNHSHTITNNNLRGQSVEIMKIASKHGAKPWDRIIVRNVKKFLFPKRFLMKKPLCESLG